MPAPPPSPPPVQTLFSPPDPNAAPLNITELVNLLNTLVQSNIVGQYIPYVIQHDTPNVDQRNNVWIQLDTVGRPIATKIWVATAGGAWRRIYNGMLGEIRMYSGNPSTDFTNGKGNVGGEYDGWALCDGNNGTTDLSDKFIIAAHMNNVGHSGYDTNNGWVTWIDPTNGQNTGGSSNFVLGPATAFTGKLLVGKYIITPSGGETLDPGGRLYGQPSAGNPDNNATLMDFENPGPVSTVPPFIAMGFIQFVGY